jgi:DNA gyrase subunit B
MVPDHRTLLQVSMGDALGAEQMLCSLLGDDVESRRNFIQQNAKDVRFLDI